LAPFFVFAVQLQVGMEEGSEILIRLESASYLNQRVYGRKHISNSIDPLQCFSILLETGLRPLGLQKLCFVGKI